jgi:glycine/D-amino acid oxidase-like deaminating enzyme
MRQPRPKLTSATRRRFLQGIAGLAAAGVAPRTYAARRAPRVGVVGAGILGASIAMHLAENGAAVLVFEKSAPAAGATRNSFAWVNAFVDDDHYRRLRLASMAAYHRLDALLGLHITWGGYIDWASDSAESALVRANALQLHGTPYPVKMLDAAALAQGYPALCSGPVEQAFWSSIDGHLDPVWVTSRFLERAKRFGASVLVPCELESIRLQHGRLAGVATTRGSMTLDQLVIAAGVDTPRLLEMAGFTLKLRHAPGMLAHSRTIPAVLNLVCDAPGGLSFKQMANGTVVGTDSPEPPDLPVHSVIRRSAIDFPDDSIRAYHGRRVLGKIATYFPASRLADLDHVTLGFRPMPTDGFPVIGKAPGVRGVYVAVTHSGVTLAPVLGRAVAAELLWGESVPELAPYRPARFVT